jgi:hypothetical protein
MAPALKMQYRFEDFLGVTIFRPRRYNLSAVSYHHARADAFDLWADYTAKMTA